MSDWTPVTSSQLAAIAYDAPSQTLKVRFKDRTKRNGVIVAGSEYHYSDVPLGTHTALLGANADPAVSVGTYFARHPRFRLGSKVYNSLMLGIHL